MTATTGDLYRRHDLDALRAFAMLLGIVLHAAMSFVEVPWAVQDRFRGPEYALLVSAIHGFRMPLFFLLSGFFTAMLWRRRGLDGLLRQRAKRIALPLVLGCVTVVPAVWGIWTWAESGSTTNSAADCFPRRSPPAFSPTSKAARRRSARLPCALRKATSIRSTTSGPVRLFPWMA